MDDEVKFIDVNIGATMTVAGNVGGGTWGPKILQGDTVSTRDGNAIIVTKIEIQGYYLFDAIANQNVAACGAIVCAYLMVAKSVSGTGLPATGIFDVTPSSIICRNEFNREQFDLIDENMYVFKPAVGFNPATNTFYANHVYIPVHDIFDVHVPINYKGNTGTVTDIVSKDIFMYWNLISPINNCVALYGNARVFFRDV